MLTSAWISIRNQLDSTMINSFAQYLDSMYLIESILYWLIHCTFFSLRWSKGNFEIIAMNAMNLRWIKKSFLSGKFAKNWNFKENHRKNFISF